jgi:hypothetical protein
MATLNVDDEHSEGVVELLYVVEAAHGAIFRSPNTMSIQTRPHTQTQQDLVQGAQPRRPSFENGSGPPTDASKEAIRQ